MEHAIEQATESLSQAFDALPPHVASPLDPDATLDLHRAINERRAAQESPEMLRRLRAL